MGRAYQKQDNVFIGAKKYIGKNRKLDRYHKSVGLGFGVPKEAKEGKYVDKKCPFTSKVNIRGRILKGMVISAGKMQRTVVLRRNYLHFIKKYKRFEKRHTNLVCHCSPCFEPKEGDIVTAGQCRPLSKTVRFNVLKVEEPDLWDCAQAVPPLLGACSILFLRV